MDGMKRLVLLVCCVGGLAGAADLAGVRNVYVLPMARGFDQYLANRLTGDHVFQIVTDPKLADAVLTERIGEGFELQMSSLLSKEEPPAEPAKASDAAPKDAAPKEATPKEAAAKKGVVPEESKRSLMTETVNKLDNPGLNSSWGRGKGTVFLVDTKSRLVLWSAFEPPKSSNTKDLDRTASDIVSRLKKDLNPAAKK
jgi:hypothetical protein